MPDAITTRLTGRPILLAHDATARALGAARITAALERERGARPVVVHVLDPAAQGVPAPLLGMLTMAEALVSEEVHVERAGALRALVAGAVPEAAAWPVHVRIGSPALQVAAEADRQRAALVVLGMHAHGRAARIFRDETTLHVMRIAPAPVLALVPDAVSLPRRVVVGVDFGHASVEVARAALAVLAPGATVVLAHARIPREFAGEGEEGAGEIEARGIESCFADLRAMLRDEPAAVGVAVETIVVDERDPAAAMLDIAARGDADLLAVASHRHDALDRWLLGSVTARLARDGSRSLLVVPPRRG
jgi:nucleotide-binding universal stress UspA family protein